MHSQSTFRWTRSKKDPRTPDKHNSCSTRSWQGQVKAWRRALHKWDPPVTGEQTELTSEDAALCEM